MEKIKPTIFVGSTTEKARIIVALTLELQNIATIHPWWSSTAFKPLSGTLEGLVLATKKYDFAIFILTPDDFVKSRGAETFTSRDNVLFEFGLFLGALGPKRVFAFAQDEHNKPLKVPSDFLGVTIPRFTATDDDDIVSSMVVLRGSIEPIIRAEGPRSFELVVGWEIDRDERRFIATLGPKKMLGHADKIKDRELLLVCRKHDPFIATIDDTGIIFGVPRIINMDDREVVLSVDLSEIFSKLKKGDVVDGYLFLLPRNHELTNCKNIREIKNAGCLLLDRDFGQPLE